MDLLNKIGLLSFILTVIGLCLLGAPSKYCYPVFAVSVTIQGYVFWKTKQWFLIAQMSVLLAFNVINYIRWTNAGIG